MKDLIAAVRKHEQCMQEAKAIGIFSDDLELLECPNSGSLVDVTAEGLLVTYPKTENAAS